MRQIYFKQGCRGRKRFKTIANDKSKDGRSGSCKEKANEETASAAPGGGAAAVEFGMEAKKDAALHRNTTRPERLEKLAKTPPLAASTGNY